MREFRSRLDGHQHMSVLFGILEQGHQMLEALNEASGKAPSSPAASSPPAPAANGGILLLGDAIMGDPPGELSLIPEPKTRRPWKLKRSLPKLLDYDFEVLLLCDGQPTAN
jgi:hypothetical protein